jgi:hypothetical protein
MNQKATILYVDANKYIANSGRTIIIIGLTRGGAAW